MGKKSYEQGYKDMKDSLDKENHYSSGLHQDKLYNDNDYARGADDALEEERENIEKEYKKQEEQKRIQEDLDREEDDIDD